MFLANALYFNEKWLVPFNEFNALDQKLETIFETADGTPKLIPFISQISEDIIYGELEFMNNEMEVVTVPYKNKDFEMQIILPKGNNGLRRLEYHTRTTTLKCKLFYPK